MTVKITRTNPAAVPAPVGRYTHITRIPKEADLFVASGQIGTDRSGNLPDDFNQQVANTFTNIQAVLASEGLSGSDLIKVNIWAVRPIDWDFLYAEWDKLVGGSYPAMTVGYLQALGLPEIQIEIEVWAASVADEPAASPSFGTSTS
ncbi:enamine deaminase RidA [Saccharibacillus sp. O16]|nr:enamine deaminase RidA [Saccharibacillus sp. O16]